MDQVAGKAFAAVNRNENRDVAGLQESPHLVDEYIFRRGVVGPGCVERDVIGQAARFEGRAPAGITYLAKSQAKCWAVEAEPPLPSVHTRPPRR